METRNAAQWPTVHRTAPITVIQSKISIMVRLTNAALKLISTESQKIRSGKKKWRTHFPPSLQVSEQWVQNVYACTCAHLHTFGSRPARGLPVCACACVPRGGRGGVGERIRPAPLRLRAPPCPAAVCSRRGAYREMRQSTLRNGYPGREKPWRRFSQTPPDGARGSQFCLAACLGALGSLPIPRWPGGSGRSRPHGVDPGPLNPSAPSPQCRRRQKRGRELGARKDPKGLFGELPWRSLDARRWSSELAAARTHGHEGRAARPSNPEGPGSTCQLRVLGLRGERT